MPDSQDWKIRGLVTEEVTKQIAPLAATVGRMDKTLRSLYRNGSDPGGPPGFLETAREEDKRDIRELKTLKKVTIERLDKVEESLAAAELSRTTAAQIVASEVKEADRKFKRRLGLATFVLAILQIINILWDHREGLLKTLSAVPANPIVQSAHIQSQEASDK